jgi:hypothetical protein
LNINITIGLSAFSAFSSALNLNVKDGEQRIVYRRRKFFIVEQASFATGKRGL